MTEVNETNNNELYLHDHTNTYSIAKAMFRNKNYNIIRESRHQLRRSFKDFRDLREGNRVLIGEIFQDWTFVVRVNSLRCLKQVLLV